MTDIFDAKILCNKCNVQMSKVEMEKNGIKIRAVECPRCHEKIIHPEDKQNLEHFKDLRGKTYSVKLRVVGNSHAVSIPKEIVDFMNEMNKTQQGFDHRIDHRMRRQFEEMDKMMRLCFEDFGRLSIRFGPELYPQEDESLNSSENDANVANAANAGRLDREDVRKIALRRIKASQNSDKINKTNKTKEEKQEKDR